MTAGALGVGGRRSLAVVGVLPDAPRVAVVGSRAAWRDRCEAVDVVVEALGRAGHALVSGGALGIDAAAHQAALRHRVPQIAVLPCGCDQPYPPGHEPLFARIVAAGGAIVFGRPAGSPSNRGVFASRNAIVVDLAASVVIAQANLRSGSMGTARLALRRRRPLAVLTGQPAAGTLLARGATALPFPAEPAVLAAATEAWLAGRPGPVPCPWPAELLPLRAALERAGPAGLPVDDLDPSLMLQLIRAEAEGLATELAPGRYTRM